jgi:toxin ParE1/3/4
LNKPVQFTRAAQADLEDIYDYTHANWGRAQADSYLGLIEDHINRLNENKAMLRHFQEWREDGLRTLVGRHWVFLTHTSDRYIVVRILHNKRDVLRHLED